MSDSSDQAVATDGGGAAPETAPAQEPKGAQGNDAYQEALAAFNQDGTKADAKPDGATKGDGGSASDKAAIDPNAVAEDVLKRVEIMNKTNADIADVKKHISDGLEVGDDVTEGWLDRLWATDEAVRNAFLGRHQNPKAWNTVKDGLQQRFQTSLGKPAADATATADRDAVASAVHSASKAPPAAEITDKQVMTMSTKEFNDLQRSMGVQP